jgi:hypothetical protein
MKNKEYTEEEILEIILKWPLKKISSFVEKVKRGPSDAFSRLCKEKGLTDIKSSESRSGNQIIVTAQYKPPLYITRTFNRNVACKIELCQNHKITKLHTYQIKKFDDLETALLFADNIGNLKEQAETLLKPFGLKLKDEQEPGSIYRIDLNTANLPKPCTEAYIMYLEQEWSLGIHTCAKGGPTGYLWIFKILLEIPKNTSSRLVTLTKQKDDSYVVEEDLCNPDPAKKVCAKFGYGITVDMEDKKIGSAYTFGFSPQREWVVWQDCPEDQMKIITKVALEGKK